jgi:hypothetical protein
MRYQPVMLRVRTLGSRVLQGAWPPILIFLGLVLSGAWIGWLAYAFITAAGDLV